MDDSAGMDEPTLAPSVDASSARLGSVESQRLSGIGTLPAIGEHVGPYEILNEIARGAMGVVYRAKHATLDRIVAIKMVLDDDEAGDDLRERFANEARAAAALDHPGIVPVFDVGQWNQCPYFAMAFIEGSSLAQALRDGPLRTERAAQIAREVAEAIGHAHHNQIIHRDLKPANILIDPTGAARVTDFGVSKLLNSNSDLTQCGELIGTPHFMPPEQAGGSKQAIGPAADVYSIGAVLFAMLTGRPPFQAASPVDVIAQVVAQPPVAPSALNSRVPSDLEVITLKCLSKRVDERYPSAQELSLDLARFLAGEPIKARPPGWLQRGRLFMRKHVMLASVSGTVAMLLVLMTITVFVSLLHARRNVSELTDRLEIAEQLVRTERRTASKFIGASTSSKRSDDLTSFEVNRLAASAQYQAERNPDLAMQLALAAIDRAVLGNLQAPEPMLQLLRDRLLAIPPTEKADPPAKLPQNPAKQRPDTAKLHPDTAKLHPDTAKLPQDTAKLPQDTVDLIEMARGSILEPLSESDHILYGIPNNSTETDVEN